MISDFSTSLQSVAAVFGSPGQNFFHHSKSASSSPLVQSSTQEFSHPLGSVEELIGDHSTHNYPITTRPETYQGSVSNKRGSLTSVGLSPIQEHRSRSTDPFSDHSSVIHPNGIGRLIGEAYTSIPSSPSQVRSNTASSLFSSQMPLHSRSSSPSPSQFSPPPSPSPMSYFLSNGSPSSFPKYLSQSQQSSQFQYQNPSQYHLHGHHHPEYLSQFQPLSPSPSRHQSQYQSQEQSLQLQQAQAHSESMGQLPSQSRTLR
eukprot:TRINITY_DN7453_c1_g1_i2.p1 TRINITY_DN7453_c1_g1~~TRINITY_DN7453_c1_g1_i2.p1  ORF type:complete len:259 (-),score=28.49 TRINITY_DN7453_c1_g1_i2:8-784(-)